MNNLISKLFSRSNADLLIQSSVNQQTQEIEYKSFDIRFISRLFVRYKTFLNNLPYKNIALICGRRINIVPFIFASMSTKKNFCLVDINLPELRQRLLLRISKTVSLLTIDERTDDLVVISSMTEEEEDIKLENGFQVKLFSSGSGNKLKCFWWNEELIMNRLEWYEKTFPFGHDEICLSKTSLQFTDSFFEMITPILFGHRLILANEEICKDLHLLWIICSAYRIERLTIVPSIGKEILNFPNKFSTIKLLMFSGEILPTYLVRNLRGLWNDDEVRFVNIYGSTEAGADVSFHQYDIGDDNYKELSMSIGECIDNCGKKLIKLENSNDEYELAINGLCLSSHQSFEDENGEVIVRRLEVDEENYYHTGDIVRMDGKRMFYLRRKSNETIKRFGCQINLLEIEILIEKLFQKQIAKTLILFENSTIFTLIQLREKMPFNLKRLNSELSQHLPSHHLPDKLIIVDEFFYLESGKIEKKKMMMNYLKDFLPTTEEKKSFLKTDNSLITMKEIYWKFIEQCIDNLKKKNFDRYKSFIFNGGNSLNAMKLSSLIYSEWNIRIPVRKILSNISITELYGIIEKGKIESSSNNSQVENVVYYFKKTATLSPAQLGFITSELQHHNNSISYNVFGLYKWKKNKSIDHDRLISIFFLLINVHQQIRSALIRDRTSGEFHQKYLSIKYFRQRKNEIFYRNIRVFEKIEIKVKNLGNELKKYIEPFPLNSYKKPLFLIRWIKNGIDDYFFFHSHHMISDGQSIGLFFRQFLSLYNSTHLTNNLISECKSIEIKSSNDIRNIHVVMNFPLFPLQTYQTWMSDESSSISSEEYISNLKRKLGNLKNVHSKFAEIPEVTYRKFNFNCVKQIKMLSEKFNVTPFIIITTIIQRIFLKLYNEKLIFGLPLLNRKKENSLDIFGPFVNILPVILTINSENDLTKQISMNNEEIQMTMENEDVSFVEVMKKLKEWKFDWKGFSFVLGLENEFELYPSHELTHVHFSSDDMPYDMTMFVHQFDQLSYQFNVNYRATASIYNENFLNLISDHFQTTCNELSIISHISPLTDDNISLDKATMVETLHPVSAIQKAFWLLWHSDVELSRFYNIATGIEFHQQSKQNGTYRSQLDVNRLKSIFSILSDRHLLLRTYFKQWNDGLYQATIEKTYIDIPMTDISEFNDDRFSVMEIEEIRKIIQQFTWYRHEIEDENCNGLIRFHLYKLSETRYFLAINMNHIICDGNSGDILLRELKKLYLAEKASNDLLPSITSNYYEYATNESEKDDDPMKEKKIKKLLKIITQTKMTPLPMDFKETSKLTFLSKMIPIEFNELFAQNIRSIAQRNNATPFMLILTAQIFTIAKWCNYWNETLLFLVPINNRSPQIIKDFDKIVGPFLTSLFITIKVPSNPQMTFLELLNEVRNQVFYSLMNRDIELHHLFRHLRKQNAAKKSNPLSPFVFIQFNMYKYDNLRTNDETEQMNFSSEVFRKSSLPTGNLIEKDLEFNTVDINQLLDANQFAISYELLDFGENAQISGYCSYNPKMFTQNSMVSFNNSVLHLLKCSLEDIQTKLFQVSFDLGDRQLRYETDKIMENVVESLPIPSENHKIFEFISKFINSNKSVKKEIGIIQMILKQIHLNDNESLFVLVDDIRSGLLFLFSQFDMERKEIDFIFTSSPPKKSSFIQLRIDSIHLDLYETNGNWSKKRFDLKSIIPHDNIPYCGNVNYDIYFDDFQSINVKSSSTNKLVILMKYLQNQFSSHKMKSIYISQSFKLQPFSMILFSLFILNKSPLSKIISSINNCDTIIMNYCDILQSKIEVGKCVETIIFSHSSFPYGWFEKLLNSNKNISVFWIVIDESLKNLLHFRWMNWEKIKEKVSDGIFVERTFVPKYFYEKTENLFLPGDCEIIPQKYEYVNQVVGGELTYRSIGNSNECHLMEKSSKCLSRNQFRLTLTNSAKLLCTGNRYSSYAWMNGKYEKLYEIDDYFHSFDIINSPIVYPISASSMVRGIACLFDTTEWKVNFKERIKIMEDIVEKVENDLHISQRPFIYLMINRERMTIPLKLISRKLFGYSKWKDPHGENMEDDHPKEEEVRIPKIVCYQVKFTNGTYDAFDVNGELTIYLEKRSADRLKLNDISSLKKFVCRIFSSYFPYECSEEMEVLLNEKEEFHRRSNFDKLNETQNQIVKLFNKYLVCELSDNFFDVGGNSVMALRIIGDLQDHFNIDIPLKIVFSAETIGTLGIQIAELLVKSRQETDNLKEEFQEKEMTNSNFFVPTIELEDKNGNDKPIKGNSIEKEFYTQWKSDGTDESYHNILLYYVDVEKEMIENMIDRIIVVWKYFISFNKLLRRYFIEDGSDVISQINSTKVIGNKYSIIDGNDKEILEEIGELIKIPFDLHTSCCRMAVVKRLMKKKENYRIAILITFHHI
ncbi:hypothetical protein SNEBB_007394, partial [Seison nebaliae]